MHYYLYMDETGTLDYLNTGGTESPYFGFGSLIFNGQHSQQLFQAQELRLTLEQKGVHIPTKFHAKDDSWETRNQVFELISQQRPIFDASLFLKENAFDSVKKKGKNYLYHLCFYLHLQHVCNNYFAPNDELCVIVSTIGSAAMKKAAYYAIKDVENQLQQKALTCFWDSSSCWGLQASDYLLWAVQRQIRGKPIKQWDDTIKPLIRDICYPWGQYKS